MNKYKVILKGKLKKELVIEAEDINKGTELIERIYAQTKLLNFKQKDIEDLNLELEEIVENEKDLQVENRDESCLKKSQNNCDFYEDYEDEERVTFKEYDNEETGEIHYSMRCPKCNQEISVDDVVEEIISQALGE